MFKNTALILLFGPIQRLINRRSVIFLISFIIIITNSIYLVKKISTYYFLRKKIAYYFPGFKFSKLREQITSAKYISYYSDRDTSQRINALQFSQAQYIVAPLILDPDSLSHEYILFDCSSKEIALEKAREIKATPLRQNQFGIILAKRMQTKRKESEGGD